MQWLIGTIQLLAVEKFEFQSLRDNVETDRRKLGKLTRNSVIRMDKAALLKI